MKETIKISGEYDLRFYHKNGKLFKHLIFKNIVPNTALAEISALCAADVGGTGWDYTALGTDDTAASATQTALLAEISTGGAERTAGTGTQTTTTTTNDTFQLVTTFNFTASHNLREIGVFNDATAGTMLSRQTMNADVVSGDSLVATYKVTFARA